MPAVGRAARHFQRAVLSGRRVRRLPPAAAGADGCFVLRAAVLCFALLFFSYALAPLAHAGFYYLGSAAQTLLAARTEDLTLALAQYNGHYRLLALHWAASVGSLALGWLVFLLQAARGRSYLPRSLCWLTPLPVGIVVATVCSAFPRSEAAELLGGATFNLAQLVFYTAALLWLRRHKAA